MKVYAKGVKEAIQKMKVEVADGLSDSVVSKDYIPNELVISSSRREPLLSDEIEIDEIPSNSEDRTSYISTAESHDHRTTQEHRPDFSTNQDDLSHILEKLAEEHEEIQIEGDNSSSLYSGLLSAHNSISGAWKAHSISPTVSQQLKPAISPQTYQHDHVQIPYISNPCFSSASTSFYPLTLSLGQEQQQQHAYFYSAPPTAMSLQQAIQIS